jgi:hypothetical protein
MVDFAYGSTKIFDDWTARQLPCNIIHAFQITSLPTVYVYKNCEVVQRLEGALPERRLKELLDNL